jgi:hypothetical protein
MLERYVVIVIIIYLSVGYYLKNILRDYALDTNI